jgi:hypothetical protein
LTKLLFQQRGCLSAKAFLEALAVLDGMVNFLAVGKVVGQRSVDVCEVEVVVAGNLNGALAETLVPDGNVFYGNAPAGDTRLAAQNIGASRDTIVECLH